MCIRDRNIDYPDARTQLTRWLPLVKWFLAIPHFVVLIFIDIGVFFAVVYSWLSITVTGHYPLGVAEFVVGAMRWQSRVVAYAFMLATDQSPPFRLAP